MTQLAPSEALIAACDAFSDNRFALCHLELAGTVTAVAPVTGTVLDQVTLESVAEKLAQFRPDIAWDLSGVRVLVTGDTQTLATYTNMTGFFLVPSWLAEQQNQVLNGTRMEALEEQNRWVLVRLEDGYLGWVYRPYLGAAPIDAEPPTSMVGVPVAHLHETPTTASPLVSRIFAGTRVHATTARDDWAEVNLVGGVCGYMPAADLRNLEPRPGIDAQRHQLVEDARHYIGVPYLWGGVTVQGIDCSGFAQLMHKLAGVVIPRDADQQFATGTPVEPPYRAGDLMYFGGSGGHRIISHVGISLGEAYDPQGWQIIHSSRGNNGVYIDDIQAVDSLRDSFQGARRFL